MKVKVKNHPYTKDGEVIEVSAGHAEYMEKTGQGKIIEKDSPVAHDMGTIPVVDTPPVKEVKLPKLRATKSSK